MSNELMLGRVTGMKGRLIFEIQRTNAHTSLLLTLCSSRVLGIRLAEGGNLSTLVITAAGIIRKAWGSTFPLGL